MLECWVLLPRGRAGLHDRICTIGSSHARPCDWPRRLLHLVRLALFTQIMSMLTTTVKLMVLLILWRWHC